MRARVPVDGTAQRSGGYRLFRADDSAARNSFVIAALWLVFGTAMGLTLAIEFVFPDAVSWLPFVFSRLRQEHTNTVMFGFLSTGMIGLWYYILPRLTGRRLWNEPLANLVLALWTVGVLVGVVLIAMAHTQSREYAEMVWGVDVAILVALVLNLVIVLMTIAHRVEPKLYVTLWFIIGTAMWMPLLYAIGNVVWNPPTGALTGINDAVWNWFYGHNVLGLWFTTGMLGVFYYLLPKETHTPLYSVKLGLISFWGTLIFYTGVGGHHLLWAPIPGWLKVTAVAESIGMILPVTAFFINTVMTMRGNWNRFFSNVSLRFTLLGAIAYIVVSFQGSQTALFGMNSLAHFTQYVPGHSHLGLLFFSGSMVIGGIYYALPRLMNCELYARRLASIQWVLYVVGFTFFFIGFIAGRPGAGVQLGEAGPAGVGGPARHPRLHGDAHPGRRPDVRELPDGADRRHRDAREAGAQHGAALLLRTAAEGRAGRRYDAAGRHDAGGGAVMRMTFKVIIVGGLIGFFAVVTWVVFLPTALWQPDRTIIAQGYTGDAGHGRTLFYSNGCNYCHTQYVREQDVAMGPRVRGRQLQRGQPHDPRLRAHRSRPLVHRPQAQPGVGAQAPAAPARPLTPVDHARLRGTV